MVQKFFSLDNLSKQRSPYIDEYPSIPWRHILVKYALKYTVPNTQHNRFISYFGCFIEGCLSSLRSNTHYPHFRVQYTHKIDLRRESIYTIWKYHPHIYFCEFPATQTTKTKFSSPRVQVVEVFWVGNQFLFDSMYIHTYIYSIYLYYVYFGMCNLWPLCFKLIVSRGFPVDRQRSHQLNG